VLPRPPPSRPVFHPIKETRDMSQTTMSNSTQQPLAENAAVDQPGGVSGTGAARARSRSTKTIITSVTLVVGSVLHQKSYKAPGELVTLPADEADAILRRHGGREFMDRANG
jgi:hypothetical protein